MSHRATPPFIYLTFQLVPNDTITSTDCCFKQKHRHESHGFSRKAKYKQNHIKSIAMDTVNSSKICRICCNRRLDDLVSLLDTDNKAIVKKLRACADITVSDQRCFCFDSISVFKLIITLCT